MIHKVFYTILKFFFYFRREGFSGTFKRLYRRITPDLDYKSWKKKFKVGEFSERPKKRTECLKKIVVLVLDKPLKKTDFMFDSEVEYVLLKSENIEFASNTLTELVKKIEQTPDVDMIYCDHDIQHKMPVFKPDFNYDLLLDYNYIGDLILIQKNLLEKILDQSKSDVKDMYEIILRGVENTSRIEHVPVILYHDMISTRTQENTISSNFVGEHLARMQYNYMVSQGKLPGSNHITYVLDYEPMVSIIIPNKDHIDDLEKCIQSIQKQNYSNYEVLIIENNSTEKATYDYYKHLKDMYNNIRILYWKKEFNYPAINNYAVKNAAGEYCLMLNNDVEFISDQSLCEMVGICSRDDVGVVGVKLLYPDGNIQHAGIIVGYGGIAGHAFLNAASDTDGYMGRINRVQNYSAVTAACMLVKKKVYNSVGGMEPAYRVAFNDVDFCLKVISSGFRIVYTPYVEAIHYESKTRGAEDNYQKMKRFNREVDLLRGRWADFIKKGDPAYNPNLTLYKWDFSLKK